MFFNRFGKQTLMSTPVSSHPLSLKSSSLPDHKTTPKTKSSQVNDTGLNDTGRRRAVAVALAVQFALPVGMMNRNASVQAAEPADAPLKSSPIKTSPIKSSALKTAATPVKDAFVELFGTPRNALPQLSASAGESGKAFKVGLDQITAGEYEKAVTTLQNVQVDHLSEPDSKIVDDTLAHARVAARNQRAAKADLLIGQDFIANQMTVQAAHHLRKSMDNAFADAETLAAATQKMASLKAAVNAAVNFQPIHADDAAPAAAPTTAPAATPVATPAEPAAAPTATPVTTPATTPVAPTSDATPVPPAAPTPPPAPMPVAPTPVATGEDAAAAEALAAAGKLKAIQQQKNSYDAMKLVEKARGEQATGQYSLALADFKSAITLDPNNQQAAVGYGEVSDKLGLGSSTSRADSQSKAIQEKIQAINYKFESALLSADQDITAQKFGDARKDIERAEVAAKTDPTLFKQSDINDFNTKIEQMRIRLETEKSAVDAAADATARGAAAKTLEERELRNHQDREKTIAGLIQDARQFADESKYTEALGVIDNIQRLDPNNAYANNVRQYIEDKSNTQMQRKYLEARDVNKTQIFNAAVEKLIPYSNIIQYSDDWPKISAQRDEEVRADRGENADDAVLQAQLDHHLPELRFNANSLSDVIDFLRDVTGTNIYVDWPALERASIAKDAPVTAKLRDIKFSKALELIFRSVEGEDEDHKLGYTLDEGVITISTKKELNKNTVTRRYDINDLLFVPTDATQTPNLSLQNASQNQTGGGAGGGGGQGGGQSLFDNANQQQQNSGQQTTDRANRVDEIKKYITDNVDNPTWKDNGGDVGSISSSPLRAVLLITQTPEAHRKIQSVLDSLRASQALQVSIETRFLTVQRNYLEDIGVNADFQFNPLKNPANPRSGVNNSRFAPISITQNQATDNTTFRDANGNVVSNPAQGSRTLDWISNVGNPAVPGSIAANPADYPNPLVVSGSYVDNFTVTFLIRAVQANVNTTSLTAPRLTLFSGQRAVLIVQTQQAYVSGLTPVVAPGAALFDPQVSTTTATGVVLSVQATVSPDRKYVFMNLNPQLARLRALVPFQVSAVVTPVNNIITGSTPQIVSGTIQLPTIDLTIVQTSVSVPDGATLLLGGQTLAGESIREQGVPVLSKIPFLKRLFTNRASSQDEQILLILVKPTILIQREQELKSFPSLSAKLN